MIVHPRGAVLELAHALVEQRDKVLQQVGNRRVDGKARALGIGALDGQPVDVLVL